MTRLGFVLAASAILAAQSSKTPEVVTEAEEEAEEALSQISETTPHRESLNAAHDDKWVLLTKAEFQANHSKFSLLSASSTVTTMLSASSTVTTTIGKAETEEKVVGLVADNSFYKGTIELQAGPLGTPKNPNPNPKRSIDKNKAFFSVLVKTSLEQDAQAPLVPLPGISDKTLELVIQFLKTFPFKAEKFQVKKDPFVIESPLTKSTLVECLTNSDFKTVPLDVFHGLTSAQELHDLVMAANYMDLHGLLPLSLAAEASLIQGEPVENFKERLTGDSENDGAIPWSDLKKKKFGEAKSDGS